MIAMRKINKKVCAYVSSGNKKNIYIGGSSELLRCVESTGHVANQNKPFYHLPKPCYYYSICYT